MYDSVKKILTEVEQTRGDDKLLIWNVYDSMGYLDEEKKLAYRRFKDCPTPETITRARRKVQELNPELQPNKWILNKRRERASKKGFFVFNEKTIW